MTIPENPINPEPQPTDNNHPVDPQAVSPDRQAQTPAGEGQPVTPEAASTSPATPQPFAEQARAPQAPAAESPRSFPTVSGHEPALPASPAQPAAAAPAQPATPAQPWQSPSAPRASEQHGRFAPPQATPPGQPARTEASPTQPFFQRPSNESAAPASSQSMAAQPQASQPSAAGAWTAPGQYTQQGQPASTVQPGHAVPPAQPFQQQPGHAPQNPYASHAAPANTQTQPTVPLGVAAGGAGQGGGYGGPGQPVAPGAAPAGADGAAFGTATLEAPEKKKGNKRANIWIAGLAIGALLGGATGAGVTALINTQGAGGFSANNGPQTITVNNKDSVSEVTAIAAKAMPSVVTITVQSSSAAGSGSGVVIDEDGHILTNNHVVSLDGAGEDLVIRVHTSDGRILPATVVGTDPYADLAVLKVEDSNLPAIEFGNSEKLNVGDLTVAIGAPLGLPGTVTSGVVSALNRGITVGSTQAPSDPEQDTTPKEKDPSNPLDLWNFDLDDQSSSSGGTLNYVALPVIQTDASINPGNSGGALLDKDGKLIGINVAIASTSSSDSGTAGSVGLGFAIPVNLAKRVAQDLIDGTKVSHGLLGATISDSSQDTNATIAGAVIRDVTPDGAAAKAGLKSGDTIVRFNDAPVTNGTDLTALVRYLKGGSTATVDYVRDGKAGSAEVTLGTL